MIRTEEGRGMAHQDILDMGEGEEGGGSLWIPICPEGYKALGCIGVYQNNSLKALMSPPKFRNQFHARICLKASHPKKKILPVGTRT
jgi:hypothetical protein